MAARSATFASAATAASSVPGPAVMISGRSAFAIQPASSSIAAGSGCAGRGTGRGVIAGSSVERRRQRLARQHQIDRPARRGHRHLMRARHHVGGLAGHAQLVIPLHDLAHHAGLVEHLLAPVDLARARAELALLGDRRAPGREDQRHAVAREVDQVVDRVAGADVDMHHHGLRRGRSACRRRAPSRPRDSRAAPGSAAAISHCGRARAKNPRRSAENPCRDWQKKKSTPCSASARRNTSPAIGLRSTLPCTFIPAVRYSGSCPTRSGRD